MNLRDDFTAVEHVPFEATEWTPSPEPTVERKMLERDGGEVARATSIVRYAPNSSFAAHTHDLGEEFIVLDGVFSDDHGDYPAGTYVRNPPGSRHRPFSVGGCTIFVKLRQFVAHDTRRCVLPLDSLTRREPAAPGAATWASLHAFGTERVSLIRLAGGASMTLSAGEPGGGAEIFVLAGVMHVGAACCARWTWLRAPRITGRLHATGDCVFWLKEGHLTPISTR
jgi:quercetin dioxygenase-like cupin family protein